MQFTGIWTFKDSDGDVCLFVKQYDHRPTVAEMQKDCYMEDYGDNMLPSEFAHDEFDEWRECLFQTHNIRVLYHRAKQMVETSEVM